MSGDLIQLLSQNFGPISLGVSGLAGATSAALAYYIYRRRHRLDEVDLRALIPDWQERDIARFFGVLGGQPVKVLEEGNLLDAIERASMMGHPVPLALPEGSLELSRPLPLAEHTQLIGRGVNKTQIAGVNGQPAIYASGARETALCNIGIRGGVHSRESEISIRGCEISATGTCPGLDAESGSLLTFSGRIVTEPGAIAIRARSGSRIVLEAPFEIQPNDQVVLEPGCEILC